MGAQLVKEVAMKTNGVAGDGTTTATVLAQAIVREGLRAVDGARTRCSAAGIEEAVAGIVKTLLPAAQIGGQGDLGTWRPCRPTTTRRSDPSSPEAMSGRQDGVVTAEETDVGMA